MKTSLLFRVVFLASFAFPSILGQQYAGENIRSSLLNLRPIGAELAFWNIKDSEGRNATLLNYFSLPTTTNQRQDTTKVQRVVITIPGGARDPWAYFSDTWNALKNTASINPAITEESIAILAPFWASDLDGNSGKYPAQNGVSTSTALVWHNQHWGDGATAKYPSESTVSSYDVLDQILRYFDDPRLYPNMKQIVVAGHSMGAQMVNRYAAVGKELLLRTPVVYWVANPASFLWLDDDRPLPTENCEKYDKWKYGFSDYIHEYERSFVDVGRLTGLVSARYRRRDIAYVRCLDDFGNPAPTNCAVQSQGRNRAERFYNFLRAFPPDRGDTVDYIPNVGHDNPRTMNSEAARYRLFVDNFNGNRSRHADFGPRQLEGGIDNPRPN